MLAVHFIGLTWDGGSRAGIGLDHFSTKLFATFINHEHEIFTGFLVAGIRCGIPPTRGAKQTAEVLYRNVRFSDSATGVSLMSENDYDHIVKRSFSV
jgi:hypothetical protein